MTEETVMQQAVEVKKQKQMEKRRRKEEGCDVVVTEQAAGRPWILMGAQKFRFLLIWSADKDGFEATGTESTPSTFNTR